MCFRLLKKFFSQEYHKKQGLSCGVDDFFAATMSGRKKIFGRTEEIKVDSSKTIKFVKRISRKRGEVIKKYLNLSEDEI